jgi:hypothetical protein
MVQPTKLVSRKGKQIKTKGIVEDDDMNEVHISLINIDRLAISSSLFGI